MKRGLAFKRRKRILAIKRRMNLVKNKYDVRVAEYWDKHKGKLAKHNLVCSCDMCRDQKYRTHRQQYKNEWKKWENEL